VVKNRNMVKWFGLMADGNSFKKVAANTLSCQKILSAA